MPPSDSPMERDRSLVSIPESTESRKPVELATPLQFLPGVGPLRVELFHKIGVRRPIDLLFLFPRSYQDIAPFQGITELEPGIRATVVGQIVETDQRYSFDGRGSFGLLLAIEGGGYVRCVWFNQMFRKELYRRGMRLVATGVPKATGISFEIRHPEVVVLPPDAPLPEPRPLPIYSLTDGLQQKHVSLAVGAVLESLLGTIDEAIPQSVRQQAMRLIAPSLPFVPRFDSLMAIDLALKAIHLPSTIQEAEEARLRFIFQEFLVFQLAIASKRYKARHDRPAPRIESNGLVHSRILKRIPFNLTQDQLRVIEEVRADMATETPMNRLVQGDVGSGKTVIAQYAMLATVANKYQAAMMVPTELLARQHFERLKTQLAGSQVMVELLLGTLSQREQTELRQRIAIGTVDIIVGTQALLSEHIQFHSLGLVVIDEQHKFGVEQRAQLRESRTVPHYLIMSATPIPRSIAMTQFGDLDVSLLREKPPGRAPVHTYLGDESQQPKWWDFVGKQLRSGRQAYVVLPRVEADAEKESLGAEQVYAALKASQLKEFSVELLHGRMDGEAKQQRLSDFENGKIQVLVATTVVEVGIDVPNATLMTILDADRLGLAQLHQLRGRVTRGSLPGYVCLFPSKNSESLENTRLQTLVATDDGFRIAEEDLKLRGAGDLLGTKQVGTASFRIADLVHDVNALLAARHIATEIIESDPRLELPEHAKLCKQVQSKHGAMWTLGDVG